FCHQTPLWSWNYATLSCKGNVGEGDCDRHTDCNTGYCARNVGVKYGQVSTMDVCEEKTLTPNCPQYAPLNCKQGEKLIVVKEIDPNVKCSRPEVKCVPVCDKICKFEGTNSEGWYDSCSEKLIQYANCSPQPAYLIVAYSKNGKNYIDVDYVEWLHSEASIKAQVEDGKCASISECYDYPNGYKRNQNPLVRTFEVSPSINIVVNGEISAEINKLENTQLPNPYGRNLSITFNKLKDAVSAMGTLKAFITIDVKGNVVTKISEPYQE
ncbi:hypothetical protein KJ557_03935, partial [Patescibacteria group bacterium]|nr:hypothetical protein [Patescibacteria group bacterium]